MYFWDRDPVILFTAVCTVRDVMVQGEKMRQSRLVSEFVAALKSFVY